MSIMADTARVRRTHRRVEMRVAYQDDTIEKLNRSRTSPRNGRRSMRSSVSSPRSAERLERGVPRQRVRAISRREPSALAR